jgi:hypothetical protein
MNQKSKSRERLNTNYAAYLFHLSSDIEGDACREAYGGTLQTSTTNFLLIFASLAHLVMADAWGACLF